MKPPVSVVLADDTEALRYLIRSILEEDGRFDVVGEAKNGKEALDQVDRHAPDLLLLDLSMPEMDGLEVLDRLRRRACPTQVIVLSGYAAEAAAEASRERGALAYIEKGVRPRDLVNNLAFLLELEGDDAPTLEAPADKRPVRIEPTAEILSLDGVVNRLVHDLRSPIGLAAGYLDLLEGSLDADDQRALAGRVRAALERMGELTKLLSAFTREAAADAPPVPIDVSATLHASIDRLRASHPDRIDQIRVAPVTGPTLARGHEHAVDEAFRAVLDNALRYGAASTIDVTVDRTDEAIVVTVTDHGPGLDPGDEAVLFRPFARGSAASQTPGAGLGLAVSARLLGRMGGRIWAQSAQGENGLIVGIELPR